MALKVLVPLDGSKISDQALDGALRILGGRADLQVTLMTVVSTGLDNAPDELVEQLDEDEDDEVFPNESSAHRMLDNAVAACARHDVRAEKRVVHGSVVDQVLEAAKTHDLLVMHALERRQIKETLRGSKTEKLARRAGIPVLLV